GSGSSGGSSSSGRGCSSSGRGCSSSGGGGACSSPADVSPETSLPLDAGGSSDPTMPAMSVLWPSLGPCPAAQAASVDAGSGLGPVGTCPPVPAGSTGPVPGTTGALPENGGTVGALSGESPEHPNIATAAALVTSLFKPIRASSLLKED